MPASEPAVLVRRGRVVESLHRASLAVARPDGTLAAWLGDPGLVTYMRSSAKPFQALPLVESGAADAYDLSAQELAVVMGSHGGEDRHVKTVEGILARAGLGPGDLRCGAHRPYHGPTAERTPTPTPLHHNCSGKHAGMLLLAAHLGVPRERYLDPASEGQRRILLAMADLAGLRPAQIKIGTDGCSAPNFAMPLRAAARAFARLADPDARPAHADALRRLREAMAAHPEMIAGEGRFDTDLMARFPGKLLSKGGAEGVQAVAAPGRGLGMVVKVEDGNQRAAPPVTMRALRQLRLAVAADEDALAAHLQRVQRNWAGLAVGGLEARFKLRGRGA